MLAALSNGVPVKGLLDFVWTFGALFPGVGKEKWTWIHVKILVGLCEQANLSAQWCSLHRDQ